MFTAYLVAAITKSGEIVEQDIQQMSQPKVPFLPEPEDVVSFIYDWSLNRKDIAVAGDTVIVPAFDWGTRPEPTDVGALVYIVGNV